MRFPEIEKGGMTADPELRWITDLRDFIRLSSFGTIGKECIIKEGTTDNEIHAYLSIQTNLSHEMSKSLKKLAHTFARFKTKKYVLQRVEVWPTYIVHLLIFRKPERKKGRKR
jgi:alpha-L-arabinofuranosidase